MALRGTLKDFGIADIFQLIGHQMKTGVLTVSRRGQTVRIHFNQGNVVSAESSTRKEKDMLGTMLVRAEVISREDLDECLARQSNTLKRLGSLLVEAGKLDAGTLKEFTRLQTTETIYRLFLWESGQYEFEQADTTVDAEVEVMRSENLLMEGFRQADEWPRMRKSVASYASRYEVIGSIDESATEIAGTQSDEDSFAELTESTPVEENERTVFRLVEPERDVQKLIDLSRLGEFETCKALAALLEKELIREIEVRERRPSAAALVGGIHSGPRLGVRGAFAAALLVAVVGGGLWWLIGAASQAPADYFRSGYRGNAMAPSHILNAVSELQVEKIKRSLETFRAVRGAYPTSLQEVVEAKILREEDLSFPWRSPYYYESAGGTFRLARPWH